MKKFLRDHSEFLAGLAVWMAALIAYLWTLAPSVGLIDAGELAAVSYTLGIAHPTGYPLFSLLGRLWSMVPVPGEEIVRLNLMAALFTSAAVFLFYWTLLEFFGGRGARGARIAGAASAAGAFAFSTTMWEQATSVEVYSLHLLLITSSLLTFFKAVNTGQARWWICSAYLTGLSFTNHMTTVLVLPAMAYLFFSVHGVKPPAWRRLAGLTIPFLLGVSVYLYLPVRASSSPAFNWGDPSSAERFLWHVGGKQFRVWMFASADAAQKQFDHFLQTLPGEFAYLPVIAAAIGAVLVLLQDRRRFLFVVLLFVACVGYSVNYDIHDIDSYFLLAFMAVMFFTAEAVRWLADSSKRSALIATLVIATAVVSYEFFRNVTPAEERRTSAVSAYSQNILQNLPSKAVVISYQWDYFVSPSYYLQRVRNMRPDVTIIDKELLRRSWYFLQLKQMDAELYERSKNEIARFLDELYLFEHGLPYDYAAIESRYTDLIQSFISRSIGERPCFVTPEIEQNYTSRFYRIPSGFCYQLITDTLYHPVPFPVIIPAEIPQNDPYFKQIGNFSYSVLQQRSLYEGHFGNDSTARLYSDAAVRYFRPF